MLYLAFIFHMHQPYYKNLLTQEASLPWVRLHGIKDYLDMVEILEKYPKIHQTFNLVPSLIEQIEDYARGTVKDRFFELSYKEAASLTPEDKDFILSNFFKINRERIIALFPRYYDLYFKKQANKEFTTQDFLDLQVCFNLGWTDPLFRQNTPQLKALVDKGRFFSEEDKRAVLEEQNRILSRIIPAYQECMQRGQIEITTTPYYHPILPLLYNTNIAKEANKRTLLPKINFSYPQDAQAQIKAAVDFHLQRFKSAPLGFWPSEEGVSEHILPFFMQSGVEWIVADEGVLFNSLKKKKRETSLLYQPYLLKREEGSLNIVFRDRNLSDLLGFVYYGYSSENAVNDFLGHLKNIHNAFGGKDILVTVAMDGENAWEYYPNDGHDFLNLLYQRLSESDFIRTTTPAEYLKMFPPQTNIKRIAAGSWIYANFNKWMDNPYKALAWDYLAKARKELEDPNLRIADPGLALKQIYIAEGSDWFWWYGEEPEGEFDKLFRMHLSNFYTLIGKDIPEYLLHPLAL